MNKNCKEGKKENGKFYLSVGRTWVEVTSEVYYGYMDLVWRENKNDWRRSRCPYIGKCDKNHCEGCDMEGSGGMVSLDQMMEEDAFEPADPGPSVEDQVLAKFLYEALHRELAALPLPDQMLIHDIYFEEIPYTQQQIARKLHISQQMVSKRHKKLLAELRIRLEAEICD